MNILNIRSFNLTDIVPAVLCLVKAFRQIEYISILKGILIPIESILLTAAYRILMNREILIVLKSFVIFVETITFKRLSMSNDYLRKPLFRMVHFDNLEYLLQNGMCNRTHPLADPNYINIGDSDLIIQRNDCTVPIAPGGNLGDYVPFYFGGHSIMLLNIKTGHRGIKRRNQADIAFIVCSIGRVIKNCPEWCFTDGHAKNSITDFYNTTDDLPKVDWNVVYLQYWHNTEDDWDKARRKQAEFLIKNYVPIECITCIVVFNQQRKEQLEAIISRLELDIPVKIDNKRHLYYP